MKISKYFWNCFFVILSFSVLGCATHEKDDYGLAYLKTRELVREYGEIEGSFAKAYVNYVNQRLVQNLPDEGRRRSAYEVVLLATGEPMAFSPGGGILVVSRGLILSLSNEAELAFVLAHEIAHDQLGHTRLVNRDDESGAPLARYQQALELEADHYALGVMALADYDPRVSIHAVYNGYRAQRLLIMGKSAHTHPNAIERTKSLLQRIKDSGWRPPGTINRREFVKFKKLLLVLKS